MRRILLIFLTVACIAVPRVSAQAQAQVDPDSLLRTILDTLEGTRLTLDGVKAGAAQHAVRLRVAEAAYLAAQGAARRERGVFDPTFSIGVNYADREDPTASFFAGAEVLTTTTTDAQAGLFWDLPTGTNLSATISTVDLTTNSGFAFLDPQYNAYGTLTLRQSLLRGLWVSGGKYASEANERERSAKARYDQELIVNDVEAEKAYWDLNVAGRNYAVQTVIVDRGRAFLRDTEVRAAAGLVGPNEVANAQTFIAEQELLQIDREEQFAAASDRVAELIGVRPTFRFVAAEEPPSSYPVEPVDALIAAAKDQNLALRASKADIEARRALSDAAGWEWLPTLDVVGSIGGSGLAGTPQDVVFGLDTLRTENGGSYWDAVHEATRRDFPNWAVGLQLSIPIGFRSGLGEKERLEAELHASEQRYIAEERAVESEVLQNFRDVANGKRRLEIAKRGVEAAQEQVRIGLIEFRNGRVTAFELVRLGEDYVTAQNRYSDALIRTAKAAATLKQLTSGFYPGGNNGRNDSNE
jgi:outer membrane protein TolC